MSPDDYTGKEIEAQPALVGEVVDDDGVAIAPEHGLVRQENQLKRQTEWHCMCGLPLGVLTDESAIHADREAIQQAALAIAGVYASHIQEMEV